ncbi:MAG: hypothetical protein DHS20C12_11650 [Pseudohongiella sp.]|nr:MAG: hypothetical protein DHS20C12_11650 [Pseudohongiella sp.]
MSKQPPEIEDDFLDDLAQTIERELISGGLVKAESKELAISIRNSIQANWAGMQPYIRKSDKGYLSERNLEIYGEFDGHNQYALARKYKLSVQQIYSIINEGRKLDLAARQPSLFPES